MDWYWLQREIVEGDNGLSTIELPGDPVSYFPRYPFFPHVVNEARDNCIGEGPFDVEEEPDDFVPFSPGALDEIGEQVEGVSGGAAGLSPELADRQELQFVGVVFQRFFDARGEYFT